MEPWAEDEFIHFNPEFDKECFMENCNIRQFFHCYYMDKGNHKCSPSNFHMVSPSVAFLATKKRNGLPSSRTCISYQIC